MCGIPYGLDDAATAAIANPGIAAWAALVQRARLQPGETVLINGATGSAGPLAVQLAKYLGAGKVIAPVATKANCRNCVLRGRCRHRFNLSVLHPFGAKNYEKALKEVFARRVNVVLDYLWGESATTVIVAIAKTVEDATPMRFVHVGGASGEEEIALPGLPCAPRRLVDG